MSKVILNFDESGNMGRKGRYFTIACVESTELKPLENVMSKAELKTKETFPSFSDKDEIKASEAYPLIKEYYLRKIVSKEIGIRYITADLPYVKKELLEDENLLYNYMLKFIIEPVARRPEVNEIDIYLDKRSIKVKSTNSFLDYIRIKLNYELNLEVKVTVKYEESQNSYPIQAADFIANVVNSYYEYDYKYYYDIINQKIVQKEQFPRQHFGKKVKHLISNPKVTQKQL